MSVLVQTLQNKGNPEVVERDGPYICIRKDAWLGTGYYFWDTHFELGEWWGKTVHGEGRYMICMADCAYDDKCWDLHGEGEHRKEFMALYNEFIEQGVSTREELYVSHIINFFKAKNRFTYTSIRALGVNTINVRFTDPSLVFQMDFPKSKAFLDLIPAVQVCLIDKTALSLQNYKVVYPDFYSEIYA